MLCQWYYRDEPRENIRLEDLALGKLGSCPGASTTRGLLNQDPSQPGAATTRGAPHMSFIVLVLLGGVGLHSSTTEGCPGASTIRGGGGGFPHMSCHLLLFWYSRVGWTSTAPLLRAAQGPPQSEGGGGSHICLVTFYFLVLLKAAQGPTQPGGGPQHMSCHLIYINTYIHTHTHINTYIHTYIHQYIRTYIHTSIHTYIHTSIHTYVY